MPFSRGAQRVPTNPLGPYGPPLDGQAISRRPAFQWRGGLADSLWALVGMAVDAQGARMVRVAEISDPKERSVACQRRSGRRCVPGPGSSAEPHSEQLRAKGRCR
jgi:hypothetical protein